MLNKVKKILWTVDPFSKEKELQRSAALAIKRLQGPECIIQPVYFFSAYLTDEGPLEIPNDWIKNIREQSQRELDNLVNKLKIKNIKPLHVISEPSLSMREGANRIIQLAKRWKSDVIVVSTHARKGIKRMFLGSFAETLLLYSDVPLFFVNPHWAQSTRFKQILFPTDFSNESHDAFRKVLEFAKSMNLGLTLYHKLTYLWPASAGLPFSDFSMYSDLFRKELEVRRNDSLRWTNEAKSKGIKVTFFLDQNAAKSVASSIVKLASKQGEMIAMASRSGLAKTALLGSTTRNVVRGATVPIWVLHPQNLAKTKSDPAFQITEADIERDLKRIPHLKKAA